MINSKKVRVNQVQVLFRVLCRLSDKQLEMSGCKKNNLLFQSSETFLNGRCGR